MNVVIDACSVINLHNGGVLEVVCSIGEINVQIGPIAGGECSEGCAEPLANLRDAGNLVYLGDSPLDAEQFLDFVDEHKLGDGEAECIMLAALDADSWVCCDDLRGRKKAQAILGEGRLVGSLGLLKLAVGSGLLTPHQACEAHARMKEAGGFLPDVVEGYFTGD